MSKEVLHFNQRKLVLVVDLSKSKVQSLGLVFFFPWEVFFFVVSALRIFSFLHQFFFSRILKHFIGYVSSF